MAYPASTKTLQKWGEEIDSHALQLQDAAQRQFSQSNASTLSIDDVRRFFDVLVQKATFFESASNVPGLAEYVVSQKQGQVADPVAEFVAMRNAVIATLNWLRTNVPQGLFNSVNYKLAFVFPADNVTPSSSLTFTAAQTAGYRTVLTSLINTVG